MGRAPRPPRFLRLGALARRPASAVVGVIALPTLLVLVLRSSRDGITPAMTEALSLSSSDDDSILGDGSVVRWLWWPAILYLFWAMAFVCDMYFVRTIDIISEKLDLSDDVAGATLMALGCNGPEMALNTIAVFHPSEIGVGAVIGGEVFNVLVIIGTALLFTPATYMPLKVGRFTFFRDVFFYILSVALLYYTLADGQVTRFDSAMLLVGAVSYITTVVCSNRLRGLLSRWRRGYLRKFLKRSASFGWHSSKMTPSLSMSMSPASPQTVENLTDDEDEGTEQLDEHACSQWEGAWQCRDPAYGSVVGVRVDVRNRLMDRRHHFEERFVVLGDDALYVSTATAPRAVGMHMSRCASGLVFDHKYKGNSNHWHHGGLINAPVHLASFPSQRGSGDLVDGVPTPALSLPLISKSPHGAKDLMGVASGAKHLAVTKFAPWEVIPVEDILYCERCKDMWHWNLHVTRHGAEVGNVITLEFSSKDEGVVDAWVEALKLKLIQQRHSSIAARGADPPKAKSCLSRLMEWVEWLQFPVKFWLELTIPDMDDPKQQHLYPISFTMSMAWLAVFAYSVVAACDGIHRDFGLSTTILGFTVAAAGTSFPNVFSGIVVARQGKTTMAVANALGANVQNVFLALAIPWTLQSWFLAGGPFTLEVGALAPAIVQCYVTLLPVVVTFVAYSFSVPRWPGALFLVTYAVYLVFALGEEASGCALWPAQCV